ncbi:MAG: YncE family protein, partial [Nitrososphaerota archaeon]|nr:YncE family protein [Nitrososphaerota archaeon]
PDRTSDLLLMLEGAKEACPTFLPTLVLVGELVSTTTTATIPVGIDPTGIASDGWERVYVANSGSNNVSEINTETDSVIANIPVGPDPTNLVFDPHVGSLFVSDSNCRGSTCGPGTLSDVSVASGKVVDTIPVGSDPQGIAYDLGMDDVWVANAGSNTVSIVGDAESYAPDSVLQTIDVGDSPTGWLPECIGVGCYFFVTNSGSDTVSVLIDNSLLIAPVLPNSETISLGSTVTLTPNAVSGRSADLLSYKYVGLPEGCSSQNVSVFNCTPTAAGTFHIRVFANNSVGQRGTSTMVLTVTSILGLPPTTFYELVTVLFFAAVLILILVTIRMRRRRHAKEREAFSSLRIK